jgi:asparagine synthetase B (glutamine-hydrolysing)
VIHTIAVGAGPEAQRDLDLAAGPSRATGDVVIERHGEFAVGWSTRSPWVDVHDDGDVLVVLDGRLHDLPGIGSAQWLHANYASQQLAVARGLVGDFLLVVLDRGRGRLLVARDPVGVRPWYRADAGPRYLGAPDLATVVGAGWVDTQVDEVAAIEYLAAIPESRGPTLYRGVTTLPPGHTWYREAGAARTVRHHRWSLVADRSTSWEEAVARCRSSFDEAVSSRVGASASAASELSGGLDSSIVVGTMVELGLRDITVGRLIFDGPRADERRFSDAVIKHWGLSALSAPPWIPDEEEADDLTRRLRRPLPDPHFLMFVGLHRAFLRAGRAEGLTGLGGDDAFVAMPIGSRVISAVQQRRGGILTDLAYEGLRHPGQSWTGVAKPTLHQLAPWKGESLPGWIQDQASKRAGLSQLSHRKPERVTGVRAVDQRLANLTTGYDAAVLEERAVVTDLVGRRESHPFLDPEVISATYGLDPWWPARGGHDRALQVAAFSDRLPVPVAQRRWKAEFSEVFWSQVLGQARLEAVCRGPLAELGWLDQSGFAQLITDARSGIARSAIPLARCHSMDRWLRTA